MRNVGENWRQSGCSHCNQIWDDLMSDSGPHVEAAQIWLRRVRYGLIFILILKTLTWELDTFKKNPKKPDSDRSWPQCECSQSVKVEVDEFSQLSWLDLPCFNQFCSDRNHTRMLKKKFYPVWKPVVQILGKSKGTSPLLASVLHLCFGCWWHPVVMLYLIHIWPSVTSATDGFVCLDDFAVQHNISSEVNKLVVWLWFWWERTVSPASISSWCSLTNSL